MIYLFYGSDRARVLAAGERVIKNFKIKHPAGEVWPFATEEFDAGRWEELFLSTDLFGAPRLIVARDLLVDVALESWLGERWPNLATAPITAIFLEASVPTATLKAFKAAGGQTQLLDAATQRENPLAPLFAVTDALAGRDRKNLWLKYQLALRQHQPAEEVFWKLAWQTKLLLWAKLAPGAAPAGVNPFTWRKASSGSSNYSMAELRQLSATLVALWHETKQESGRDLALELEQQLLAI